MRIFVRQSLQRSFFLGVLATVQVCMGAAYTSTQAGNWSDTATWGGLGPPGDGDTVTIAHNVTVDTATTVGHSPQAGDATQAVLVNDGVTLTFSANFTLKGDLVVTGAYGTGGQLVSDAGTSLTFDASGAATPSTACYVVQLGTASNQRTKWTWNGTAGSHGTIISNTASSACPGRVTSNAYARGGMLDWTYVDGSYLGDATNYAIYPSPSGASDVLNLDHVTCDTCGEFYMGTVIGTVTLQNVTLTNCQGSYSLNFSASTGTVTIDQSVFSDKRVRIVSLNTSVTFTDSFVFWGIDTSGTAAVNDVSNVLIYKTANAATYPRSGMRDIYVVGASTYNNPHFMEFASTIYPVTAESWILEYLGTAVNGDGFLVPGLSATGTVTVQNSIVLPNAAGDLSGSCSSALSGANTTAYFYKNSCYTGGNAVDSGYYYGETYAGRAGMFGAVESNLFWGDGTGYKINHQSVGTVDDVVDYSAADYNGGTGLATGSAGKGYNTPFTGGSPGAHDLSEDPGFVAERGILDYDLFCGGDGTESGMLAGFRARNTASEDACYTPAKLINWVRAGWAPQNVNFATGGHDGGRIGAVDPVAIMGGVLAQ